MKTYSRFFLQFVKGLVGQWLDTDAYLFHTKLIRVTDTIREKNTMKAMTQLSLITEGFGGGTKLGESLEQFNQAYAKHALNSRTVVIIMSDGYDTGSPEKLAQQLKKLKQKCYKIIWLNPMLGREGFEPVTNSMQQALPYIDVFAPAHNLRSLMELEDTLVKA